jgi:hypothetical protein
VEAELGGSRQVFALPAAEFGRMGCDLAVLRV